MEGDIGKIYIIRNRINNKVYIGKTIKPIKDRWRSHLSKWSTCTKLKNALQELGKDNFYIEIIEDNIPYSILDSRECYYISLYNSIEDGYNTKIGNHNISGRDYCRVGDSIRKRIMEDYLNGISPLDIAIHFRLGLSSVYKILSENNVPKRYNKGGFNSKSKIDLDTFILLRSQGYKTSFIANYFNVAKSSVKRFYNRHKDIILPRVSDILPDNAEDEDVL